MVEKIDVLDVCELEQQGSIVPLPEPQTGQTTNVG